MTNDLRILMFGNKLFFNNPLNGFIIIILGRLGLHRDEHKNTTLQELPAVYSHMYICLLFGRIQAPKGLLQQLNVLNFLSSTKKSQSVTSP